MPRRTFVAVVLLLTAPALAAPVRAQVVPLTPPPSNAAPVPESAAEANARAIPGPPVTHIERSGTPGKPDTIVTIYPSNLTPPPPAAFDREYPLCSETVHDSCRNPGPDEQPALPSSRMEALRPPNE
jgi:hypothetical protein